MCNGRIVFVYEWCPNHVAPITIEYIKRKQCVFMSNILQSVRLLNVWMFLMFLPNSAVPSAINDQGNSTLLFFSRTCSVGFTWDVVKLYYNFLKPEFVETNLVDIRSNERIYVFHAVVCCDNGSIDNSIVESTGTSVLPCNVTISYNQKIIESFVHMFPITWKQEMPSNNVQQNLLLHSSFECVPECLFLKIPTTTTVEQTSKKRLCVMMFRLAFSCDIETQSQ